MSAIIASPSIAADTQPPPSDADKGLTEIVVTAQKRAENVQNVPLSIAAVTGDALHTQGINSTLDLGKAIPSLRIYNHSLGSSVTVRIRGFGSASNTPTDSDVASYVDGAFIPRPGAILSSLLDVQNVEVLRGPQGTLFGRNAAMGAISINTNGPSRNQSFEGAVEGGNYGSYKGTAILNTPVSDQFAGRLAMQTSHTDGIYHNNLDGKTYGRRSDFVGRLSARWDIRNDISWTVRVDGSRTTGDGVNPFTVDAATASPAQLAAFTAFTARYGGTPPVYSTTPSFTFNQNFATSPYLDDYQYGITSDFNWHVSPVLTLRLIDSYRDWHNDQQTYDSVGTSLSLVSTRSITSSKADSHELQLISSKDAFLGGKLGFTSGIYYFHEDFAINTGNNLGSQFCGLIYGARAPQLVAPCLAGPQYFAGYYPFTQTSRSFAGYIQANYALLKNLELDLGVRVTSDKKSGVDTQITPNAIAVAPLITAEGPDYLSFKETRPSFRASLSWHPTERILFFATYSTGYKSGGFNNGSTPTVLGSAARTFKSETVSDIEAGLKAQILDGRLIFNATFFNTNLHNFQDRSYDGISFLVRNAGDVRARGVDIDGRFRVVPSLTFDYAVTYLDSIYTKDVGAPGLEGCTGLPGCPLVQDLSGKPLGFSPKWDGHVGADWRIGTVRGFALGLRASENFVASFLTVNTDNPQSRVPAYQTTDLRLSVTSPNGRWKFELFGTNIFDRHYYILKVAQPLGAIIGVNNTATGATVFRGFLGDPGRYGGRVSVKF
ncbi:iron complex outermembrane receptor protein [Sphingomonas vulcanisoli]|uniref:Iron complex outermembrane receptor protein n=1 Tax=Sphingomonas vulcanisoli TaxID=1658060 RepID=A0ABX0TYP1_9SPHN|nr:TonB-dependent receptor [Sphingomonas vulcanisoli]NIJ09627.1 iron complex outermembrane receptor protein [Sphingomonas vulcanisoli]